MRVLGIDLGLRRVGLALSDPTGTLARPWQTLEAPGPLDALVASLARIVDELARAEEGLERIVIGLPRRLDGSPTDMTGRVEAAGTRLQEQTGVPVAYQDERLTSREAESRLAIRDRDWRSRKRRLDAAAAAIILQDYLDGKRA